MTGVQLRSLRLARRMTLSAFMVVLLITITACQSGDARSASDGPKKTAPQTGKQDVPAFDSSLSVDEAYAAIPHRRTQAQFAGSSIPKEDSDYLLMVFSAIDQAILLRVTTYRSFAQGHTDDQTTLHRMDKLISFLQRVNPPSHLKAYHERIEQAVSDQRAFFGEWQKEGADFKYGASDRLASDPRVASSSKALKEAYGLLMQSYPRESQHNKEAFFDYHCALDFL